MRLVRSFYNRNTLTVAKELLGKFLVHRLGKKKIVGMILETEAYCGPKDLASHASRGMTKRTEIMFGEPGHAYVYLIYGMYYCFNIVTERKNYPAAVLIRGIKPYSPQAKKPVDGPGKVCQYMKIDKRLNGVDATKNILWVENRGFRIKPSMIRRATRIGVDFAGVYEHKPWRFCLAPYVHK